MHPKTCLGESLVTIFSGDGILLLLFCGSIKEKEVYYVGEPEEVRHLVLHPSGVTLSVALFGQGRRV